MLVLLTAFKAKHASWPRLRAAKKFRAVSEPPPNPCADAAIAIQVQRATAGYKDARIAMLPIGSKYVHHVNCLEIIVLSSYAAASFSVFQLQSCSFFSWLLHVSSE